MGLLRGRFLFEPIAHTANGFNVVAAIAQFFAQSDNQDIHAPVRDREDDAPHRVNNLGAGKHPSRALGQKGEDLKFSIGQIHRPTVNGYTAAAVVDGQVLDLQHLIFRLLRLGPPSEYGANPSCQHPGADDYVTKPFSPRVLTARVRAVLRRRIQPEASEEEVLEIENLSIHNGRRSVTVDGRPVDLTYTEFQVLSFLAKRPGWVFTRTQIVDAVRGDDYPVTDRSVDVQIVGLRKKLGESGHYIETVRGVGYRFKEKAPSEQTH